MRLSFLKYGVYVLSVALSIWSESRASQDQDLLEEGLSRTPSGNVVLNRAASIRERFLVGQKTYESELPESDGRERRLVFSAALAGVALYTQEDAFTGKPKPRRTSNTRKIPREPSARYDLAEIKSSDAYLDFARAIDSVREQLMDVTQAMAPSRTRSQKRKFIDYVGSDKDLTEISALGIFEEIDLICRNSNDHRIGKNNFKSVMTVHGKTILGRFDEYEEKLREGRDTPQNQPHFDRYHAIKVEFRRAIEVFISRGSF